MIELSKIELRAKQKGGSSRPKHERTVYRCPKCGSFHLSSL